MGKRGEASTGVVEVHVKWASLGDPRAVLTSMLMLLIGMPAAAIFAMGMQARAPALSALVALSPLALFLFLVGANALPMKLRAGGDGIALRWLRRERFIPYRDIDSIQALADDRANAFRPMQAPSPDRVNIIDLRLRGGKRLVLRPGHFGRRGAGVFHEGRALVTQLERGVAEARLERDNPLDARLARNGRGVDEWLGSVVREVDGVGYRAASIDRGELLRTVTSPATSPTARAAGAAVLRRMRLLEEERVRIRFAAASSLAPGVRVALEAAAEEEAAEADVANAAARVRES